MKLSPMRVTYSSQKVAKQDFYTLPPFNIHNKDSTKLLINEAIPIIYLIYFSFNGIIDTYSKRSSITDRGDQYEINRCN